MVLVALNMVLTAIIAGATARVVLGNHIVVACKKKEKKRKEKRSGGGGGVISYYQRVFRSLEVGVGCMMPEEVYGI